MQPIDKELRSAIMNVAFDVARLHPELNNTTTEKAPYACRVCRHVHDLMKLLDAEQREYGPPIDVTDPRWLRDHPTGAPA
jgi:hypothetical protein